MYHAGSHHHGSSGSSLFYERKRVKVQVKIQPPQIDPNYSFCHACCYKLGYYAYHYIRRLFEETQYVDDEFEELDTQLVRYKPESLEELLQKTRFSKKELKTIYRGFKQGCPAGFVNFTQFKEILSQLFPHGDSSLYAKYVFNSLPKANTSQMSFEDFIVILSTLSRGSVEEKLQWTFRLYDADTDGYISCVELYTFISAIYNLIGKNTDPPIDDFCLRAHTRRIFKKMDLDGDQRISFEEFLKVCLEDDAICQSLCVFDTFF